MDEKTTETKNIEDEIPFDEIISSLKKLDKSIDKLSENVNKYRQYIDNSYQNIRMGAVNEIKSHKLNKKPRNKFLEYCHYIFL